ncbi:MAG: AmmeMemoRadiSam system protein B [bacterium]
MELRRAFFSGSWYPSDPGKCRRQIESFLASVPTSIPEGLDPLGGIVPHAGWVFSGRIAASVMASLKLSGEPDTIVIFGSHLGPEDPSWIMPEGAWETPLGPMEVDQDLARYLMSEFSIRRQGPGYAQADNTIEVQLPMLRYFFPKARILPLGLAPTQEGIGIGKGCAELILQKGIRSMVLGSTDLTHYGPGYGFCPKGPASQAEAWVKEVLDGSVIKKFLDMDPEGILVEALDKKNACCPGAAAGAVACLKTLGATRAHLVHYATSRDVMEAEDFVGYAGVIFGK